jgi:hypothetical protein
MAAPKMRLGVARRRRGKHLPDWSDHIKHVGEVTFAWTQLQGALFTIFLALLKDFFVAQGLWHCIRSDATQHQMLAAVAQAKLAKNRRVLTQILWVIDCASKIATARNDLTHTGLTLLPGADGKSFRTLPDFVSGRLESAKRLFQADDQKWVRVSGDIKALEAYARMLGMRVLSDPNAPPPFEAWPRRPKLLSIVATKKGGRSKKRPAKTKAKLERHDCHD